MKYFKSACIFSAALVFGTAAILASVHQAGLFIIANIPVEIVGEGENDSSLKAIESSRTLPPGPRGLKLRTQTALEPFSQKKIWDVHLSEVKAAILKDEWVKDALISRTLPNHIRVKIVPKETALVLVGVSGELWPVTEDGAKLATLRPDFLPDSPLLRGDVFAKDSVKRKEAVQFALHLPTQGMLNAKNVSEIFWTKEDGYSIMLMQPKVEVKLGTDSLDTKVVRAGQVMNYMSAHQLSGRVIDASFSKKVLVRLRKGP